MKQQRTAGLQLEARTDLLAYTKNLLMPPAPVCRQLIINPSSAVVTHGDAIFGKEYHCIPQNAAAFGVDGACFTGPTQIKWIQQLVARQGQFVLHIDGKYKLHHGIWILITLGTHMLKRVGVHSVTQLQRTFVPLVYLFSKNHESVGAITMVCRALDQVSMHCFSHKLEPGALMSDHSDGCRTGMLAVWPSVPHGQCWPHIRRKLGEGAFCSKKHPHFDDIPRHLEAVHFSQSARMRDFIILEIGKRWDSWGSNYNLSSFWDEYMVEPWDNWSLGLFDTMLCTPSQQEQESWHKTILTSKIPGMFKGSTEHVMKVALQQLINMDGTLISDGLLFSVPGIPKGMWDKAKWYSTHRERLHMKSSGDSYMCYLLSQSSPTYKKMDALLVSRYDELFAGKKPHGLTKLESFIDLLFAVHVVQPADEAGRGCPMCEFNPLYLVCTCKGFRHVGICSHVLVVNHWLDAIDVSYLTGQISGGKRAKGGFRKGIRPALVPEAAAGPSKKRQRLA